MVGNLRLYSCLHTYSVAHNTLTEAPSLVFVLLRVIKTVSQIQALSMLKQKANSGEDFHG